MSAVIWGEDKQQGEGREKMWADCIGLNSSQAETLDQRMNREAALSKYLCRNTYKTQIHTMS